jgi:diguanylate cyclase (GGDEF)-like protein/PAS domain S-box-containing protein
MFIADLEGLPTMVNPAMCAMLGREPAELVGSPWTAFGHPDDVPLAEAVRRTLDHGVGGDDSYSDERRYLRPDGSWLWVTVDINVVRDGANDSPSYHMGQVQDITARKRFEAQLEHRALHDELTDLPNRALLNDRIDQALGNAARNGDVVGVAFIDIDGFKHVNDALGHAAGDDLLVEVARRLSASVEPTDTVARFGGDEFVLVRESATRATMTALVERITKGLCLPCRIGVHDVAPRASAGITLSRAGSTGPSLLSEADAAMYRAKQLGGGGVALFDESLRTKASAMLGGERRLRTAIADGEIVPFFQPIVDLASGDTVGFEALARWMHPDDRIVGPAHFIPLAESTGLILALGESILGKAASAAAAWNASAPGAAPLWVSVNLSARQLVDARLADLVATIVGASGLDPRLLHLEITETTLMENLAHAVTTLQALKELGVTMSIDDFGTGYSSLAYLRRLPVDMLKIDRSFVDGLDGSDPDDTSVVEAILGLGHALRLDCVAEGIETRAQADILAGLGCRFGQGYLWSRPMHPTAAADWARHRR